MKLVAKRAFDILAASAGLVVTAPLMACLAVAIFASMRRPVLFRQTRTGYRGVPFTLFKLRTMTEATDPTGKLLPDGNRLTPVGRFIRSTSLDELPQLYNVLRGDMSIVGPRPLLPEYLPLYTAEQARRLEVRPGLTSWHAVKGRNAVSWERQFLSDLWYVEHRSLSLDLRIIAMTVIQVLRREGINQVGHATREPFRGSMTGGTS